MKVFSCIICYFKPVDPVFYACIVGYNDLLEALKVDRNGENFTVLFDE